MKFKLLLYHLIIIILMLPASFGATSCFPSSGKAVQVSIKAFAMIEGGTIWQWENDVKAGKIQVRFDISKSGKEPFTFYKPMTYTQDNRYMTLDDAECGYNLRQGEKITVTATIPGEIYDELSGDTDIIPPGKMVLSYDEAYDRSSANSQGDEPYYEWSTYVKIHFETVTTGHIIENNQGLK